MEGIENIETTEKSKVYKIAKGKSPNALYKDYTSWHREKHGDSKNPLAFKDWLSWAKKKSIVKSHSADGTGVGSEVLEEVKSNRNKFVLALSIIAIGGIIAAIMMKQETT